MRIAVLFKVVPDPEGEYKIGPDGEILTTGLPQIPSIFDEHALEAAIQIKDATKGKVVVVSCGPAKYVDAMLYRAMAMGADEVALVEDEGQNWDSLGAARVLAAALRELGHFDVVLCGREAADTSSGLVGPYVALELGIPFLTLATNIKADDGGLRVARPWDGGQDIFLCRPPILITVSNEANRPRMPSVVKLLQAKKKPIQRLKVDLQTGSGIPGPVKAKVLSRSTPSVVGNCTFIDGASAAEMAAGLVDALRAERVI